MKNFLLGVMAAVLCLVLMGANYQAAGPKKYEYKPFFDYSGSSSETTNLLNKEGADGWKLIAVHRSSPSRLWYCFYEREKR